MAPPNLHDPTILADPYPIYREAFAAGPVCPSLDPSHRTVFVGHHAQTCALLRDSRLSSNRIAFLAHRLTPPQRAAIDPLLRSLSHWQLFTDPPDHTPLRRRINAALSRRLIRQMQPDIEQLVAGLLDAAVERGRLEVVTELAYPLPATVIARMLGAPLEDADRLRAWSRDIARFIDGSKDPAIVLRAQSSVLAMTDYFRQRLTTPCDERSSDLLAALRQLPEHGPPLSDEALLANCVGLMLAGHETTTHLIANAVHLLLDRPALALRLRDDPDAWDSVIEEVLRFESPVQRVSRVTTEPVEIGGTTIDKGHRVIFVLGAANRDPRVFDQPDRFDPERQPNPHLGFGFGIHLCSGAALARLEARCALQALFTRLPDLQRVGPVQWSPNFGFRAQPALELRWSGGPE